MHTVWHGTLLQSIKNRVVASMLTTMRGGLDQLRRTCRLPAQMKTPCVSGGNFSVLLRIRAGNVANLLAVDTPDDDALGVVHEGLVLQDQPVACR
jgi:hypothetical protein